LGDEQAQVFGDAACAVMRFWADRLSRNPRRSGRHLLGRLLGFGAVNLALLRLARMILLGFDYDTEKATPICGPICKPIAMPGRVVHLAKNSTA